MKPIKFLSFFSLLFMQNLKAQDSLKTKETVPHHALLARITFSKTQSMRIHIMAIKDSSVFVFQKSTGKPDPLHKINIYTESKWDSYNYRFIESIKVNNKKLRSWLLPTSIIAGAFVGGLIGWNSGKHIGGLEEVSPDFGKILLGGLLGGAAGTITGLVICSASEKKYLINGDWKSFEEMKASLKY
jgi:hypothetical protein